MPDALISVIETSVYRAKAAKILTELEREAVVDLLAREPERGELIQGGGGIRKVRVAFGGRGKSGGARVIYYFHGASIPRSPHHDLCEERQGRPHRRGDGRAGQSRQRVCEGMEQAS